MRASFAAAALVFYASGAAAQTPANHEGAAKEDIKPASDPPGDDDADDERTGFFASAYVEAYYQYNFNEPGNGITNGRGVDGRHDTVTLSNVVLDVGYRTGDISGHVALQTGSSSASGYGNEPVRPGTESVAATGPDLWRFLQQATVGYRPRFVKPLLLEAGLFLTSFGYEAVAVKDNWNYSRTNAALALMNYATGVKATYDLSPDVSANFGVYNGWNSVVDNNHAKSFGGQVIVKREHVTTEVGYFGGIERDEGGPEGAPFRHMVDVWAEWDLTEHLQAAAEVNVGVEGTTFGPHVWGLCALYGRTTILKWLAIAARFDSAVEHVANGPTGSSSRFLLPASRLTSETFTIDLRPVKSVSLRFEGRHDDADGVAFFRGAVAGTGEPGSPYVANAKSQSTFLVGVTGWYK